MKLLQYIRKYYLFILLLLITLNCFGKKIENKYYYLKFGAACKVDYRIPALILPISDTNFIYPPNTGPIATSGMKTYRIILPEFLLEFNYKLKNENVILLTSLGYEQRGLLYKEYYFDKYNQFESIEYIYSYLKFRLGICYEVGSFSFIGCVNIGSKINSNVKYNLKGGGSYSSPHPVFNSLLSTKITPEINIRYSILKKSSLNPQINFGIEPLLNGTKVYSFSLGIICSII